MATLDELRVKAYNRKHPAPGAPLPTDGRIINSGQPRYQVAQSVNPGQPGMGTLAKAPTAYAAPKAQPGYTPSMVTPSTAAPAIQPQTGAKMPAAGGAAPRPTAQPQAARAPMPSVQPGVTVESLRAKAEQRRLREMLRSEQEGFSDLDPASRGESAYRMEQLRAAHRGLSAENTPLQAVQTPEQVEAGRERLRMQARPLLEQRLKEEQAQGVEESSGVIGADVERIRRLNAVAAKIAETEKSIAMSKAGTEFGPTPTNEQLQAEGDARAMTRDSQIAVGREAMGNAEDPEAGTIRARIGERERVRKANAAQEALALEAQNAELGRVAGDGNEGLIRQLAGRAAVLEAEGGVRDAEKKDAYATADISNPDELMRRIAAAKTPDELRVAIGSDVSRLRELAAVNPVQASRIARDLLAIMPEELTGMFDRLLRVGLRLGSGSGFSTQGEAQAEADYARVRSELMAIAGTNVLG